MATCAAATYRMAPYPSSFRSKTKTGCLVCRKRHVKCDETKPNCLRCQRMGACCHWPLNIQHPNLILLSTKELRSLQYYRENTAEQLAGHYDQDFWTHTVLRLSYSNVALQHLLIALGSLDEAYRIKWHPSNPKKQSTLYLFSLEQYGESIRKALDDSKIRDSEWFALTLGVLTILYEMWLGHVANARRNTASALRLICHPASPRGSEEDEIFSKYLRPMIVRNSVTFLLKPLREVTPRDPSWTTDPNSEEELFEKPFRSIQEAAPRYERCSSMIMDWIKKDKESLTADEIRRACISYCHRIDALFDGFTAPDTDTKEHKMAYYLLRIKYHIHRIALLAAPLQSQMAFDAHMEDFEAVIKFAEQHLVLSTRGYPNGYVSRSHDKVTTFPLIMVARFCRDPFIRRRAIHLLSRYPRLEGFCSSAGCAVYSKHIMMLEEAGLRKVEKAADIPESHRVTMSKARCSMDYIDDLHSTKSKSRQVSMVQYICTKMDGNTPRYFRKTWTGEDLDIEMKTEDSSNDQGPKPWEECFAEHEIADFESFDGFPSSDYGSSMLSEVHDIESLYYMEFLQAQSINNTKADNLTFETSP